MADTEIKFRFVKRTRCNSMSHLTGGLGKPIDNRLAGEHKQRQIVGERVIDSAAGEIAPIETTCAMTSKGRFSPVMESDSEGEFLIVAKKTSAPPASSPTLTGLESESRDHRTTPLHSSLAHPKLPILVGAKESPAVQHADDTFNRPTGELGASKERDTPEIPIYAAKGAEGRARHLHLGGLIYCLCWISMLLLAPLSRWLEIPKARVPQCIYIR